MAFAYIQAAIGNPAFYVESPITRVWNPAPGAAPGAVILHRAATTTKTQAVALQAKLLLNAAADYTGKLSSVFSPLRHVEQVLPVVGGFMGNSALFDSFIRLVGNGTELSDGHEWVNDLQGAVNGEALAEVRARQKTLLTARVFLAAANLIGLGFYLQSIHLIQFKAVWIVSDLIPSRILGMINYIANHSATSGMTAYLPESVKSGVTNGSGRLMALPLSSFLGTAATVGYASFFGLAAWQAYKDGDTCTTIAHSAKFAFIAGVGLIGIQNKYAKAALGLTSMVAVGYRNYRNVNG